MSKVTISVAGLFLIISLMSCTEQPRNVAQGYVEGNYTYVATPVSGILENLLVDKGYQVKRGQLLFELDKKPEIDAYNAANENYQQARSARDAVAANLQYSKITFERNKMLVPTHAMQQSELDRARSNYESDIAKLAQAEALVAQTRAQLEQSKWTLEQKSVVSPVDAVVFDKYYRVGEYTLAQQPILSLLAPKDIKAIFYVNANALGGLRLNDKVSVRCDNCKQDLIGRISFISPTSEFTPPVIYSNETNEKLIFRIEAVFAAKDAVKLHPGQPIYVTYYFHER